MPSRENAGSGGDAVSQPKPPSASVEPWMMVAACRVIHGKQAHSDWIGARPPHLPEQACEWAAMTIAEEAPRAVDAALLVLRRIGSGTCERGGVTELPCPRRTTDETRWCYPCQARAAVKEK